MNDTPLTRSELDALNDLVQRNRAATERMYEIDEGVGGLGVAHPEMLDDWSAYQDAITADSDEATLPERLLVALAAERARADQAMAVIEQLRMWRAKFDADFEDVDVILDAAPAAEQ